MAGSPRSGEGQKRRQNDGRMPRGFCALCDAPNWLAAESVHASRAAPSLRMAGAISMPPSIANKTRLSKAGCEQASVLSGGHNGQAMGMRAQIGAQTGSFRNSEGAVAQPDTFTCQDGGATDTTRKQTRMGNLPPMSAKSTTQQSRERRSNDSVWKVKCFEEAGEKRLSPQWRVEPQCESHSSQ